MAIGDYITCCKCGCKLIYDGDRGQRDWWQSRWGDEPQIECPDCKKSEQKPVAWMNGWGDLFQRPDDAERGQTLTPLYAAPQPLEGEK